MLPPADSASANMRCFDRALTSLAPIISSLGDAGDIDRNAKHPFVNYIRLADDMNEH